MTYPYLGNKNLQETIPYKFSKTQNLRREMAAVQYTVKKHLLESSLYGSDRNHVTSTSLSWTNK